MGEEEENWRKKNRGVGGGEGMPAIKTPICSFLRLLAAGNPIELQHSAKISPTLFSNDVLPPISKVYSTKSAAAVFYHTYLWFSSSFANLQVGVADIMQLEGYLTMLAAKSVMKKSVHLILIGY